ncbi:hypothetical protein M9458_028948, partial [Cirrhinus mrigala]
IEEKALLFLPDICQVHPQMSLCYHHGRHRSAHSSGDLLSGMESKIRGADQGKDPDLYPGLSANQPGMPQAPPLSAMKQQPDLLLHMPCHLSEGLDGREGALRENVSPTERERLTYREI